jgi:hypothetical protein
VTDKTALLWQPLLESALDLACRGWRVFPCACGSKRPALRGDWRFLATADPGRIRAWWAGAPYNIGISCGPSGLVVIDLDVAGEDPARQDVQAATGASTLAALCARHGQPCPPPTYTVDTPSGGTHLYYTAPRGQVQNSAGRLGRLIDVRADGGYVIGAGSQVGGRKYVVTDGRPPVPLPGWIATLTHRRPHSMPAGQAHEIPGGSRETGYALAALREETRLVSVARPGTRNDTLNRAAFSLGQLTAAGLLPQLAVVSALASAAECAGLPSDEACRTIRSGMTAGARWPRRNTPKSRYYRLAPHVNNQHEHRRRQYSPNAHNLFIGVDRDGR